MYRSYNYIYKQLVSDENDVVGHVAYALYKSNKIEYIEQFKKDHNGMQPTEEDLKPFHDISSMPSSISRYKTKAVEIVGDFLNVTLAETAKQIEEDYRRNIDNHLVDIIEPLKPKSKTSQFWKGVLQSILGAFFFAIIVAAFAFIRSYNKNDDNVKIGQEMEQMIESTAPCTQSEEQQQE
ncbi:MAG: hypothetical protein IKJ56_09590 [Bacteroidales bacterium]|nr:hypothetical protein [Bacteroidales bacterium]